MLTAPWKVNFLIRVDHCQKFLGGSGKPFRLDKSGLYQAGSGHDYYVDIK
jgi:hypothetical protein